MGKERNIYIVKEKHSELHILDKYKKIKAIVLIDTEDVNKLQEYCFRMHNKGYITTSIKGRTKYLHQIVYGNLEEGFEIDHINRNKLDNRKCNLRQCKHIDNTHNRIKENKYTQQGISKLYSIFSAKCYTVAYSLYISFSAFTLACTASSIVA